jgi:hypothetical protein
MSRGSCRTKCRDLQGLRPVSSCEMRGSPRPRIRRGAAGRGQLVPAILSASGLFATEFLHICRAHVRTDCHTYMSIGNTNWLTRSFQDCCIADGSRPPRLASAKVSLIQYLGAKARGTRCRQGRVDATFTPRGRLSVPDGLRQGGSAPLWSSSRVGNLKHLASPRADQLTSTGRSGNFQGSSIRPSSQCRRARHRSLRRRWRDHHFETRRGGS